MSYVTGVFVLSFGFLGCLAALGNAATARDLRGARDRQDRAGLQELIKGLESSAGGNPQDAKAQYRLAMAESMLAEVSLELRMKNEARSAAEAGIRAAEKAVALEPQNGEYHRILGTLCGQVIPANVLAGLKYGKCALQSVNKALDLNPKSSDAHLSRGVGNYYLPPSFGGGVDKAIVDMKKATELDPKNADAYVWLGVAYRKANQNKEARASLQKALSLNPNRIWAKQLLEKTPE